MKAQNQRRIGRIILLGLAAVVLFGLAGTVLAGGGGGTYISRYVFSGGGQEVQAGNYTLNGSIGQPIAGQVGTGSLSLCSGYWCNAYYEVYLPVVIRNY